MNPTERSLDNIKKINEFVKTPDMSMLLYAVLKKDIDAAYSSGKRVVFVEFLSTQRLVEWVENGDCLSKVGLTTMSVEDGAELIGSMYPQTIELAKKHDDVITIVVACNMIIKTQVFSTTGIIHNAVDIEQLKQLKPKHFGLESM